MTDPCYLDELLTVEEAKLRLAKEVCPIADKQSVSLDEALTKVLAENIISPLNVPPFNNAAMDGYAVCNIGDMLEYQLVGTATAGQPFTDELLPGQCIRIMTGATVPDSATSVVMQEKVTRDEERIFVKSVPAHGANIRLKGEDIAKEECVLNKGRLLSAFDVGLLASIGLTHVKTYRQLTVAVFSTGNELVTPGQTLRSGQIYDSNGPLICSLLKQQGFKVLDLGIIADDPTAIRDAFEYADKHADAVISSGGVSVGDTDYTQRVLADMGEIAFWKVAMKPGKPMAFGRLQQSYFFGLPGNPVSASITFNQLVSPTLAQLAGLERHSVLHFTAQLSTPISNTSGRTEFQRGVYTDNADGSLCVSALSKQGSGVLSSLCNANCLIEVPSSINKLNQGDSVKIIIL